MTACTASKMTRRAPSALERSRTHVAASLDLSDEFLSSAVGNGARDARKILGLERAQAAEILGSSASYLGKIEIGSALPSVTLFARMVDEYGVSADMLLGWRARSFKVQRPKDVLKSDQLPLAIGAAVRSAREEFGISRRRLAERIGIIALRLTSIEQGEQLPRLLIFSRLVEELDLVADDVLTGQAS